VSLNAIPMNGQTWLICGGRDFADQAMFDGAMSDLIRLKGCPEFIVHGDARGADAMAEAWGKRMGLVTFPCAAHWKLYGKAAGVLRNQAMIDYHGPALVVAFPGGKGTADMVARARRHGIDVAEIQPAAVLEYDDIAEQRRKA
jgi:hypothetical protein